MTRQSSEFSTHRRDGEHVTKRLSQRHPAGSRFVTAMSATGYRGMQGYLDALHAHGVRLPDELRVVDSRPVTVCHRWVPGPTLLDAADRTDPAVFAAAIADIAGWIRALDGSDARVDANLANFCLLDDAPVLVDVLPPLIPSLRPQPATLFDELLAALCFDTPVVLDALVGYALRASLRTRNWAAGSALVRVVRDFAVDNTDDGFPATWFRARRRLATSAASGTVPAETVHEFFALTSVLGFRQLSDHARRHRIDVVARRLREWS